MEIALIGIGGIFLLLGLACYVVIYIHAFKSSVGEGFLCLCVPCYVLYYMFSKFEHSKKGLIIAGALGGSIIGNVLVRVAGMSAGGPTTYDAGYY